VSLTTNAGALSLTPILLVLTVLLALFLAAIIRTPPWTPEQESEPASQPSQFSQPEPASDPPTAPLPRRVAGGSGWVAPVTGELTFHPGTILPSVMLPGTIQPPRVSGGPPWEPAPKPPPRWLQT